MSSGVRKLNRIDSQQGAVTFSLVLISIIASKSLYFEMFGDNKIVVGVFFVTILIFVLRKAKAKFSVVLFSYAFFFVTILSFDVRLSSSALMLMKIVLALLLASLVRVEFFTLYFSKIIKIIATVSLLSYPIIFFQFGSPIFEFISTDERTHSNFILFAVTNNHIQHQVYRINGLWWEPGAFHVFFTLSFLFDYLFNRLNRKLTVYYLLVSFLIGSTTGIISIGLILISKKISIINVSNIVSLILIVVAAIFIALGLNIMEKFDLETSVSLLSRYNDFIISYNMFLENPIFGYGYGTQVEKAIPYGIELIGYDNYFSLAKPTGADGVTMFIAQVGLFGLPFILLLLFPNYGTVNLSKMGRATVALAILITFNTQNFTYQLMFNVLIVYSFLSWKYKINYVPEQ